MSTFSHASRAGFASFACFAILGCTPNVSERDIRSITLPEVLNRAAGDEQTRLVDARSPSRYRQGHLPNAVNIQISDIEPETRPPAAIENAEAIIVYGQNPGDPFATGLTLRLLEAGFGRTFLYRGGVDEWTAAGKPLVTPTETNTPSTDR